MCGLFGIASSTNPDIALARASLETLSHRGPDGQSDWTGPGVYVGHRRLSVLDLSAAGTQPMISQSCVISVNGEIYNFAALKKELQSNYDFKSESDSEVILHGYQHWGIDGLLQRLEGMYAFAIYDLNHQKVILARDRVGIKPLYFMRHNKALVWGSELKSIAHYMGLSEADHRPDAILDFVTYRYIPAPKTLYKNVYKLAPASYVEYLIADDLLDERCYWEPACNVSSLTSGEAEEETRRLLRTSISEQRISDVPLGAFLSGGVDSGLLAALYSAESQNLALSTYSIGFDDERYDERKLISATASHLGIQNQSKCLYMRDVSGFYTQAKHWFDEPFADFSMLPTYAVCQFAREFVTVALSGDGADELFAGYPRYLQAQLLCSEAASSPTFWGKLKSSFGWSFPGRLARLLESQFSMHQWDWYCHVMGGILPNESAVLKSALGINDDYDHYWLYKKYWRTDLEPLAAMRFMEFKTSLPEAMLTKVDRVSMANSLEVRVPYLSTRLIELAFSLDANILLKEGRPKYLLRKLALECLPDQVTHAQKKGFGIPKNLRLNSHGKRCSVQFKALSELFGLSQWGQYVR